MYFSVDTRRSETTEARRKIQRGREYKIPIYSVFLFPIPYSLFPIPYSLFSVLLFLCFTEVARRKERVACVVGRWCVFA
jgi:hypothetical protein